MIPDSQYNPILPDRFYLHELCRPWKVITFCLGLGWLLYGAVTYGISDWDIGISVIMAGLTYLCAPWSVHLIESAMKSPRMWLLYGVLAAIPALFTVDWVYCLYHQTMGNQMARWDNFKVSIILYFICGIVWNYRGSLRDFRTNLRQTAGEKNGR
jgi:hypothetical protein